MYRKLDMLYVSTFAVGIVGMQQVMLQLFSTCCGVNVSLNATSFALELAR
jgi:hypothetical protein